MGRAVLTVSLVVLAVNAVMSRVAMVHAVLAVRTVMSRAVVDRAVLAVSTVLQ